jgi:molybdate transport system ATP-binding protein
VVHLTEGPELGAAIDARFATTLGSFHLDVDFRAEGGSTTVLLGGSGCGKSTVLRLLAGLLLPDEGYFALNDVIYVDTERGFATPAQERPIGYVFQEYNLFPHLSVFENVAFGLRMQRVPKKTIPERVAEVLEQVHLVGYDDRRPAQLSGGQQQRVAIARALALRPRLLMLDESLAALDIQTRRDVQHELRQLLGGVDLTAVMVSHQYTEALLFADEIIVLDEGRILQQGHHLDLLQHPESDYVAEMVGVNRLPGRLLSSDGEFCRVALGVDAGGSVEVSAVPGSEDLRKPGAEGSEVAVVVHPRSIRLYETEPDDGPLNVLRGEVTQVIPLSAAYTRAGDRLEGVLRASVAVGAGLPLLRADVSVGDPDSLVPTDGATVYASFAPAESNAFA